MRRTRVPCLLAMAALAACGSDPEGTIVVVVGEETDALSRAPAPTTLVVDTIGLDRSKKELTRVALPADEVSLGDLPRSDVGALGVTGLGAAGETLLRGESLYLQWGALEGGSLSVFVQRTGELARPPNGPPALEATTVTTTVGRYVFAAAGTTTFLYDLLNLRTLDAPPTFPRPARSLATFQTTALVIDEAGATAIELDTARSDDVSAPSGASFAEVAGGMTIAASDGSQYVVGATRLSGGTTPRILVLASDGKLSAASLTVAREGACAVFIEGRGLVVYGGSADGAGAEVLAPGSTLAAPLAFPPDAIHGCGAAALDPSHLLVAGKDARVVDLACTADCKPAPWPGTLDLVRAEAVALAPDAALVVGDDAGGATRAIRASAAGPRDVPLKTPRRGAHLIALPQDGFSMIVGGGAPGLEQYVE